MGFTQFYPRISEDSIERKIQMHFYWPLQTSKEAYTIASEHHWGEKVKNGLLFG